jgi:hypothetical protein
MLNRAFLIAALALGFVWGCANGEDRASEDAQLGSLRIPLEAPGPSGTVYRLDGAVFDFAGPTATSTSGDAGQTTIVTNLAIGSYQITLREGWRLIRVSDQREVKASLASANPVAAEITDGVVTDITFVFNAGREKIPFGLGQGRINISINETGNCDLDAALSGTSCAVNDPVACVCQGCNDDGACDINEDCACHDCDTESFCASSCNNDGVCSPFIESCACADCAMFPACRPFVCDLTITVPQEGCDSADPAACVCTACNNDGQCGNDDDCSCPDCLGNAVCGCNNDGQCSVWAESCDCADCAANPSCP